MHKIFFPIILFLSIVLIGSCAAHKELTAKPELISLWNSLLWQQGRLEPYVAQFRKAGASLTYVAAQHEYGINSDTFKTIKKALLLSKPRVIIVEGISDLTNERREGIQKHAYQCAENNFKNCGEDLYGVYLALKKGVLWDSGEPAENQIRDKLVEQKYSERDIAFFYLVRQIRQLRVEKNLNEKNFEHVANETLANFAKHDGLPKELTTKMFLAWYDDKMHKPFVLSDIDSETAAPTIGPNMTFLNHISAAIGKIRDEHILNVIASKLNLHKRVLVIYGGSHFLTQYNALVDILSSPRIL